MGREQEWRDEVLDRLARLSDKKANDAVKLAFVEPGDLQGLDEMDFGCLSELKRHANGAVEIKLVDRVATLEKLFDMAGQSGNGAQRLFEALERSAQERATQLDEEKT